MFTQTMVPWSIIVQVVLVLILLSSLASSQVSSLIQPFRFLNSCWKIKPDKYLRSESV